MWQKPPSSSGSSSYHDLENRIVRAMQHDAQLNEKIMSAIVSAYENSLMTENVVLSRPERQRLFQNVTKRILGGLMDSQDKQ